MSIEKKNSNQKNDTNIIFRLNKEDKDKLEYKCKQDNIKVAKVLRSLIDEYLNNNKV